MAISYSFWLGFACRLYIKYNRVSMKNRLARIKTAVDEEGSTYDI